MDNWDEVRTAYHVARMGTVSGAAEALGVHHATVIRHIDSIEARLGTKLFQRHARGYTATEAGRDLLAVAQVTDDQFHQLSGRIKGRGEAVTGDLNVTTLSILAPVLIPSLVRFQALHPELVVRLLTSERVFRLEYGEAHVAIRGGGRPEEPDNVVQEFVRQHGAIYASRAYLAQHGTPTNEEELCQHRWVSHDNDANRAPFFRWIRENVPAENIVFRATEDWVLMRAVRDGAGIGFMTAVEAANDPELVEILAPKPEWMAQLWIVTHVDLHRTTKVQAFTAFLKEEAARWEAERAVR